jgi:hypothetical protein
MASALASKKKGIYALRNGYLEQVLGFLREGLRQHKETNCDP